MATARPRNTLDIQWKKVNKAYLAKREDKFEKTETTYGYSFGTNDNNTGDNKGKEKIAKIIFDKETNNGNINNTDFITTIEQIKSAFVESKYNKGDCIDIPIVKSKVKFTEIKTADLGDEVYIVIETENLKEKEIRINLKQAVKKGVQMKDAPLTVQQDDKDVKIIKATIGEFAKDKNITNGSDFTDMAIAKIKLEPKDKDKKKEYIKALNDVTDKKTNIYLVIDAESENNSWVEVIYDSVEDATPNLWYDGDGDGEWFELGQKKNENSQYYIYKTGKIKYIKGVTSKNEYYVEKENKKFKLLYTLDKNSYGMVKIPESGDGFNRYGTDDAGGTSGNEVVGKGDHYLLPKTAAALFGIINEVDDENWEIHLGDMSSENGSDPWQSGFDHHAGHGHNGTRKGLDVDFRYLNSLGKSFKGLNSSSNFDSSKNKTVFELAYKYGFKKNYCTNVETVFGESLDGVLNVLKHKDHGHIGLSDIDLEEVKSINITVL